MKIVFFLSTKFQKPLNAIEMNIRPFYTFLQNSIKPFLPYDFVLLIFYGSRRSVASKAEIFVTNTLSFSFSIVDI